MRISDWSSDVCSSDLRNADERPRGAPQDDIGPDMRVNLVIGEGRPPLIARRLEQGCGDRDREEQAGVAPAANPPHAAVGRAAPPENELRHHRDDSSEARTEERSVGKECVSTGISRGLPYH